MLGAARPLEPTRGDEVRLHAEDRLHVGVARGAVEVEDAVHVPVVGDPDRGLAVGGGLGDDVRDARRAVEHRVLGVQVEMHERAAHEPPRLPSPALARRQPSEPAVHRPVEALHKPVDESHACDSPTLPRGAVRALARRGTAPHLGRRDASRGPIGAELTGHRGVDERHVVSGREHDIAHAAAGRGAGSGPSQPPSSSSLAGEHPGVVPERLLGRRRARRPRPSRRGGSGTGRRPSRRRRTARRHRAEPRRRRPTWTWPWSAVTTSVASPGSASSTCGNEPVGGRELGGVVRRRADRTRARPRRCPGSTRRRSRVAGDERDARARRASTRPASRRTRCRAGAPREARVAEVRAW